MSTYDDDLSFGRLFRRVITLLSVFIVISCGFDWFVRGNKFLSYKVLAPKQEEVRQQIFENTKSYNQSMVQELQNLQLEYVKADKDHKNYLTLVILYRVADFPQDKMPKNLHDFVQKLKREHGYEFDIDIAPSTATAEATTR